MYDDRLLRLTTQLGLELLRLRRLRRLLAPVLRYTCSMSICPPPSLPSSSLHRHTTWATCYTCMLSRVCVCVCIWTFMCFSCMCVSTYKYLTRQVPQRKQQKAALVLFWQSARCCGPTCARASHDPSHVARHALRGAGSATRSFCTCRAMTVDGCWGCGVLFCRSGLRSARRLVRSWFDFISESCSIRDVWAATRAWAAALIFELACDHVLGFGCAGFHALPCAGDVRLGGSSRKKDCLGTTGGPGAGEPWPLHKCELPPSTHFSQN